MSSPPEQSLVDAYLAGLDASQLATLARRFQTLARDDGAFVILADGAEIAIPPILSPLVVDADRRLALATDARRIVSAIDRQARALLEGAPSALRDRVLSSLSPLESAAMQRTYRAAGDLATARVDFLVDTNGVARALEVNTTIPAMQGYSDAVAIAFLRALGEQRGVDDARVVAAIAANGRNTDDLLASLLDHHERAGGKTTQQRIAIIARHGDSQGGELDHYVRRWSALGHDVFRATPERVRRAGEQLLVDDARVDLLYRHVFLQRLALDGDFAQLLFEARKHHIWNPPSSHLELKAMLGLLSASSADPHAAERIGLTDDERSAVGTRLPWTRLCIPGPTTAPDGSLLGDLVDFVMANAASLVLKRSWDYGGRGVFLGAELGDAASQVKLRALLGNSDRPYAWHELVEHIVRSGEAWVVQVLVDVRPDMRLRIDDTGPAPHALYTDLSAFTSLGHALPITGGAVRAATSRIVNIHSGGGLVPLVRAEALRALFGQELQASIGSRRHG